MKLGTATILRSDARALPLADNSVDLIVTSPPYFALRSYQDGGEHYAGQIGDEPTPAEFVDSLLEVTHECVRVLKPSGSLWVNLGDKYNAYNGGRGPGTIQDNGPRQSVPRGNGLDVKGVRAKSLIGIPWRYALRCIDDLGLILRAEVVWSKPNGLPESVTDRVRRSHEVWFHFTLQPRYFSAVDEIREPHAVPLHKPGNKAGSAKAVGPQDRGGHSQWEEAAQSREWGNPLGKLPGSVWTVEGGESVTRSVLSAVAAGVITIEEGERILWTTTSASSLVAGNGAGAAPPTATGRSTSQAGVSNSRTASPTSSTLDPSLTGFTSTTSAATGDASTPTISSQSPKPRTTDAPTPSEPAAATGTVSTTPTSTSHPQASRTRSAGPAPSHESDAGESVWQVPTEPLRVPEHLGVDHFAAFPTAFPKRIIQGWSPAGVCVKCGEGRRPVANTTRTFDGEPVGPGRGSLWGDTRDVTRNRGVGNWRFGSRTEVLGYACACPEPTADTTPAVVLDPFGGTGTTAMVAKALGRHSISVDMSADYCRLAAWRTNDRDQLAKVLGVAKAEQQPDDQLSIFDMEGGAA